MPGLAGAFPTGSVFPDLSRGGADATLTLGGGTITSTQVGSAYGWAWDWVASSAFHGSTLAPPVWFAAGLGTSVLPDFTVLLLGVPGWSVSFHHHSGTFGNQFVIDSESTAGCTFRFDVNYAVSYSPALTTGEMVRMAYRKSGTTFSVWADGRQIASVAVGAAITGDDSQQKRLALPVTAGQIVEQRIHATALSDEEIALDAFDPFAPYRGPLRDAGAAARRVLPWHLFHSGYSLGI